MQLAVPAEFVTSVILRIEGSLIKSEIVNLSTIIRGKVLQCCIEWMNRIAHTTNFESQVNFEVTRDNPYGPNISDISVLCTRKPAIECSCYSTAIGKVRRRFKSGAC